MTIFQPSSRVREVSVIQIKYIQLILIDWIWALIPLTRAGPRPACWRVASPSATTSGTSSNPEILTTSESNSYTIQVHDRQTTRREQAEHGWASGDCLPAAGCRNLTVDRQPRWLQTEVPFFLFRLKEIEKKDLDRHSYEIQIKELTEKAFDSDRFRKESDKWREFSQKQAVEIEEYKKKVSEVDSNIQGKYHKALKQIENMHKDNSDMKNDLNQAIADINAWRAKFDALERTKNREIDEIKNSFENNKRFEIERELKDSQVRAQN